MPSISMGALEQQYEACVPFYEEMLENFVRSFRDMFNERGLSVTLRHRVKKFPSWYKKLVKKIPPGSKADNKILITDVLGIRVVCPFLEEVDHVSHLLQETFSVQEFQIKGADFSSGHFGYESVHFLIDVPAEFLPDVSLPEGFPVAPICEIQIRTILQEAWSEVEHELIYKSDFSPMDEPLKRKLAALNANLTLSDIMFQEIRDYQKELHSALRQRRKGFYEYIRLNSSSDNSSTSSDKGLAEPRSSIYRDTVDSLLLQGLLLHNSGKYSEAVNIYSKILSRELDNRIRSIILVHRGMAYFSSGYTSEASDDFGKALHLDPSHTKARYYRAVQFRVNGNFDKAYEDLNACIRSDPYNLEYLTARAETSIAAGDSESAIVDCNTVLRIDPGFKPALRLREILED